MHPTAKSCAVAFPSKRNNATFENSATGTATESDQIVRKPASIKELRAQLIAQQRRNNAATSHATGVPKVAHEVALEITSQKAMPDRRDKADLAAEFMAVDGMVLDDATALAEQCHAPRPAHEWMTLLAELDRLLIEASRRFGLDPAATDRILAARRGQALATIPETLNSLRGYVATHLPNRNESRK